MTEKDIKRMLDELADVRAQVDLVNLQKQELINTILTLEIRQKIAEIEAEFAGKATEAQTKAALLEADIKAAVVAHGATIKGTFYQAIWMKGRESWDGKALSGYMAAHPEISAFRTVGEPSVSLRVVK